MTTPRALALFLLQALITAILGSASNDIMIRGYVFGHLRGKLPMRWVIRLSTALYILDDVWNEGWDLPNMAFSFFLGLALALTVWKTGRIWMSTGIHIGSNFVYYTLNGFSSGAEHHGLYTSVIVKDGLPSEAISIGIMILLALVVWVMMGKSKAKNQLPA